MPQKSAEEYLDSGLFTCCNRSAGAATSTTTRWRSTSQSNSGSTCASSAWVLNYLADHACILAHFPEEPQHDVWSENNAACIATSAAPTGKVTVVPGGYRLDGRWSWCSGLRHSQWILIGGLAFREGEDHPDMRLYLVPVSEVKQDDTWYCAGLRATGSSRACSTTFSCPDIAPSRFARCGTRSLRDRKSTPIRFTAPRSSRCIRMRCSGRRSVRRAAPMPTSWNGRVSAI